MRCFRPRRCRPGLRGRSARPAWALPGGYGTNQREQLRGEYGDVHGTDPARWPVQHPGVVLDAVPAFAHGRASAAIGWMCEVIGWATPTGSNEHLHGRTDTKSPMVYSSTVHVAGGEEGSIRHDDDGRPAPSDDSQCRRDNGFATMINMNRLRELRAELGFIPATTDAAAIDGRERQRDPQIAERGPGVATSDRPAQVSAF